MSVAVERGQRVSTKLRSFIRMICMDGYAVTIEGQQGLKEYLASREEVLSFVEQLRGGANRRFPFNQLESIVQALIHNYGTEVYKTYAIPETSKLTLHRVRRLEENEPVMFADKLGSRTADNTNNYGRCHVPKKPLCYCSLYEDIALAEVNAETGQRYAIATYEITQDLIVLPIGELDYFRRTGITYLGSDIPPPDNPKDHYDKIINDRDKEKAKLRQFVDAFFADEFISPASNTTHYKLTAALAKVLFEHRYEKGNPDAIFYPSVAFRAGYNFAIRPDAEKSKMKLLKEHTRIVRVKENLGYGIYEIEDEYILKSIGNDGQLEWEDC